MEAQAREITKLEEKYQRTKKDLEDVSNNREKQNTQIKTLEQKFQNEKAKQKLQKQKILELSSQVTKLQQQNQELHAESEKQVAELLSQLNKLKAKTDLKEEIQKQTLEKEMRIANLEIINENNEKRIKELVAGAHELTQELEKQKQENEKNINLIKSLQSKRELAINEIKNLSKQLDIMKLSSNQGNSAKNRGVDNSMFLDHHSNLDKSISFDKQEQVHTEAYDMHQDKQEPAYRLAASQNQPHATSAVEYSKSTQILGTGSKPSPATQ